MEMGTEIGRNSEENIIELIQQGKPHSPIILFDGVCNLCNKSVQFIIKNDPKGCFKFASIQSSIAQQILEGVQKQMPEPLPDSIILIENNQVFYQSTAALRIAKHFQTKWRWLHLLLIFPAFLRNAVYRIISKNRYKWWGKQQSCWLPLPHLKSRFLG